MAEGLAVGVIVDVGVTDGNKLGVIVAVGLQTVGVGVGVFVGVGVLVGV